MKKHKHYYIVGDVWGKLGICNCGQPSLRIDSKCVEDLDPALRPSGLNNYNQDLYEELTKDNKDNKRSGSD
jgi:hypothetical protein